MFLWLPTSSRWPKIVVKVENRRVAKLPKSSYYVSDKSFFCLLKYHNDCSTIPIAFILKVWSTSIEMISTDTMKEDSLNILILNCRPEEFNDAYAHSCTQNMEAEVLAAWANTFFIIMNIINPLYNNIVYCDKHWNTERMTQWLTLLLVGWQTVL